MTTLTDRMRTCAAYIMEYPRGEPMPTDRAEMDEVQARIELVFDDAAALLIAAATEIDVLTGPIELGEPMEVIPQSVAAPPPDVFIGTWTAPGDKLVSSHWRSTHACPHCDSRANKTVRRIDNRLMLVCPACAETWEYKR